MFGTMLTVGLYAGTAAAALCLIAGVAASRLPHLELANDGRPFALVGTGALLAVSAAVGDRRLMLFDGIIFAATVLLFLLPFLLVAKRSKTGALRLRIITFNVEATNTRYGDIVAFIAAASPDFVLLQEVDAAVAADLARRLGPSYAHMFHVGQSRKVGLALISKLPCVESGTVEWSEFTPGIIWARVRHEAISCDVVNVYLADPFHPTHQTRHIDWLIAHVRSRDRPLILAGDFNLTPFSAKLTKFACATKLRRHGTLLASWPARKFPPAFLIDNVFASDDFRSIKVFRGPFLGSDHRPIVADITMSRGVHS
jgi:endonuclease/exonuclease/phosphatase (EEP) superfamily protein YafD